MTWGDVDVAVTALGTASCATMAFRVSGELRVVAVVKATFILSPDAPMVLTEPEPIVRADKSRDKAGSLVASSELVPYRPRADVLLYGHARAPMDRPTPAMAVRLMIARGQDVVLDKRLAVRGMPDPTGKTREPSPFAAMMLAWELSLAGPDNPVGIREGQRVWPHILDPRHREVPACFGPLSPRWPSRRRLLRTDESAFAAPIPELPRDFAWAYFNAAPEDQRIDFFRGDEWVGFEGMNSQLPRVQSCLPGVRAQARVYGPAPEATPGQPIPLEADTMTIDADRLRCSVVWRGSFPVARAEDLASLQVVAGIETARAPLSFPTLGGRQATRTRGGLGEAAPPPEAPRPKPREPQHDAEALGSTMAIDIVSPFAAASAIPFGPSAPAPRRDTPSNLPAATPFERARMAPAPAPAPKRETETVDIPVQPAPDGADSDMLPELLGTLPIDARLPPALREGLPFVPARGPVELPPRPALGPLEEPDEAGGTMVVSNLLAGPALPFGPSAPAPAPAPRRSPPPPALDAGSTIDFSAIAAAAAADAALPFHGQAPAPVTIGQQAALTPGLAEPPRMAPLQPAPIHAPAEPAFIAPAMLSPPLEPVPEGEAPQTLGAHFLAAMARAGRLQAQAAS